jgi:hypothetical protein
MANDLVAEQEFEVSFEFFLSSLDRNLFIAYK